MYTDKPSVVQTEAHSQSADNLLPIQNALAYLYRNISVDIPSPNLSMQITDIARVPTTVSITALDHRARWFDYEEVAVKSVRHLRGGEPIRSVSVTVCFAQVSLLTITSALCQRGPEVLFAEASKHPSYIWLCYRRYIGLLFGMLNSNSWHIY